MPASAPSSCHFSGLLACFLAGRGSAAPSTGLSGGASSGFYGADSRVPTNATASSGCITGRLYRQFGRNRADAGQMTKNWRSQRQRARPTRASKEGDRERERERATHLERSFLVSFAHGPVPADYGIFCTSLLPRPQLLFQETFPVEISDRSPLSLSARRTINIRLQRRERTTNTRSPTTPKQNADPTLLSPSAKKIKPEKQIKKKKKKDKSRQLE